MSEGESDDDKQYEPTQKNLMTPAKKVRFRSLSIWLPQQRIWDLLVLAQFLVVPR